MFTVTLNEEELDLIQKMANYVTERAMDGKATAEQAAIARVIYEKWKSSWADQPMEFTPEERELIISELNDTLARIAEDGEYIEDEEVISSAILKKLQK